jgi:alpha-ketoglutarate-dependent taurine dioxygenase
MTAILSEDSRVRAQLLQPGQTLPLVIQPVHHDMRLIDWITQQRDSVQTELLKHGAILFRDFTVKSVEEFERVIVAVSGNESWVQYREAATPRSHVSGHIYTSTEYSAKNRIYLHNENSHVTTWPGKLFFYCQTAPQKGGETPLADVRKVFARISPDLRERFMRKGWRYTRTFGFGLGFTWQVVFSAKTKEDVQNYCQQNYMAPEWLGADRLRVHYRRWAALAHPLTKEMVWFNHGMFYNLFTLEPGLKAVVRSIGEDKMPYNTFYGDGSRIELEVLQALDAAYRDETVRFSWKSGDVLIVDNMLTAHGRQPFEGKREVFVGMTDLVRCEDIAPRDSFLTS